MRSKISATGPFAVTQLPSELEPTGGLPLPSLSRAEILTERKTAIGNQIFCRECRKLGRLLTGRFHPKRSDSRQSASGGIQGTFERPKLGWETDIRAQSKTEIAISGTKLTADVPRPRLHYENLRGAPENSQTLREILTADTNMETCSSEATSRC